MPESVPANDFTIGWVCVTQVELAAAVEMMDKVYTDPPPHPGESQICVFGRVGVHNIVATCVPATHIDTVLRKMVSYLPSLHFGIFVGLGGGVPNLERGIDIRLGDVVISQPTEQGGGVIRYDLADGRVSRTGSVGLPPAAVLDALTALEDNYLRDNTRLPENLSRLLTIPSFASPEPDQDTLYNAYSPHITGTNCANCHKGDIVQRKQRKTIGPALFLGTVASGDRVVKDGRTRDWYSHQLGGILCFDMEAARATENFPCLAIRGICDYADAHTNKLWQSYAIATATAYAKELLLTIPALPQTDSGYLTKFEIPPKNREPLVTVAPVAIATVLSPSTGSAPRPGDNDNISPTRPKTLDASTKTWYDRMKEPSFACPYAKKDPLIYPSCVGRRFLRVRDTKKHLQQSHLLPNYYCIACKEPFRSRGAFDVHVSTIGCQAAMKSSLVGLASGQRREPVSRTNLVQGDHRNPRLQEAQKAQGADKRLESQISTSLGSDDGHSTENKKWFIMWDILFPGMTRPSSPYVDDEATVSTLNIDEITRQHTIETSVDTAETKTKKEVPGTESDATSNTQTKAETFANNLKSPFAFASPQVDSTDFGDLDSESGDDSIFSLAESLMSLTSAGSISVIENGYLVKEFANLIRKDKVIMALVSQAVETESIGALRMRNNFRRLLRHYARSLKGEAKSSEHSVAATFVSQFSDKISSDLFSSLPTEGKKVLGNLADQEGSVDRRQKVEDFLRCRVVIEQQQEESSENEDGIEDENEEADANEDELYDGSLSELRHITRFLVDSLAFQTLRQRLQDFVHPSMTTELRGVLSAWLKPGSKRAKFIRRYELRNLITELQFVPTSRIRLERKHGAASRHSGSMVELLKSNIETRTGGPWDWWPLKPTKRPLGDNEDRVLWTCLKYWQACGDERWAEIPVEFAKRLESAMKRHPKSSPSSSQSPPSHPFTTSSRSNSKPVSSNTESRPAQARGQGYTGSPPSTQTRPSITASSAIQTPTQRPLFDYRILLMVRSGSDYQLAQIGVEPLKCHQFFRDLKARYRGLRGYVRMWFSVWVYSHCDFYMCEKFEDHEFVPKKEHEFPEAFNLDYDFIPKPAEREAMPPVTPHEFYRRFYACYDRTSALHFHHHCRKLSGHSGDILDKFPKKRSELEEGGDARVVFWGIYARERIAMVRVLCYNFVCVLPMLVFFFGWLSRHGPEHIQDAAVPVSVMTAMLSLFWSVFLSSIFSEPRLQT
ncbi:Putative nucleoside phosphorylase superfamily [Colletotrichum destructivum]|uniref:Nucleoside phosphorylase superfamily n=1 Tax=Colletotrichum destructivum TaxID=34406 RepID=A0AAX4I059_9PEZI|nr:Putative nucleoside phosphorylase superfamily [Colletotrichum destructivum]